mgnify:CR=1 FL=1
MSFSATEAAFEGFRVVRRKPVVVPFWSAVYLAMFAVTLLMIVVSFLSAVVCYREYLHIGVGVLPAFLPPEAKALLGWVLEACMLATNLFMVVWGVSLVETTWFQSIAEFPIVSAGMAYLPIPVGGALTALFVVERLLTQKFFADPPAESDAPISSE